MTDHKKILKNFRSNLPMRSWLRRGKVLLRREAENAHKVALGAAIGMFVNFLPFPGFGGIGSILGAWLAGGSIVAAFLAQIIGNPWTLAPILWAGFEVGEILLNRPTSLEGEQAVARLSWMALQTDFLGTVKHFLLPLLVGGTTLGLAFGLVTYVVVHWQVSMFWKHRQAVKSERAARHRKAHEKE